MTDKYYSDAYCAGVKDAMASIATILEERSKDKTQQALEECVGVMRAWLYQNDLPPRTRAMLVLNRAERALGKSLSGPRG